MKFRPAAIAVGVFVVLTSLCLLLWRAEAGWELRELRAHTQVTAAQAAARLEEHIAMRLALVEDLRLEWAEGHITTQADFTRRGLPVLAQVPSLQAIHWKDADGTTRWAVPAEAGGQAAPRELRLEAPAPLDTGVEISPAMRLTRPVALEDGGYRIAALAPVLRDGRVLGYLQPVFHFDTLVESCLHAGIGDCFSVQVHDGQRLVYGLGDPAPAGAATLAGTQQFSVLGRAWTLTLTPVQEIAWLSDPLLGIGLLFSIFLAGGTHALLRRQARLRDGLDRLAESEARYRHLIDHAPLGIVAMDSAGRVQTVNDAHLRLIGAPDRDAMLQMSPGESALAAQPGFLEAVQRCTASGSPQAVELSLSSSWGLPMDVRVNLSLLQDTAGERNGLLVMAEDIRDRKQAERDLQRRVDLDRLITRIAADMVNRTLDDLEAGIEYALEAIGTFVGADRCTVFEVRADDATCDLTYQWRGQDIPSHRDQLQGVLLADFPWMERLLRHGESMVFSRRDDLPQEATAERLIFETAGTKSGAFVPMLLGGSLFGHVGFACVREEVQWTEDTIVLLEIAAEILVNALQRRRAETALRESEEQLRITFAHAGVGIAHLDLEGRFLRVNPYLSELLGYPEAELLARTIEEVAHEEDREFHRAGMARALSDDTVTYSLECVMPCKVGEPVPVLTTMSLVRTATGEPRHFVCAMKDLTELKRAEEERRDMERQVQHTQKLESLGILASGIAHDFNNLLMGVLGNAGVALMDLSPDSPVRESVEAMETAALRAADLTKQLLAYSGKGSFVIEPLHINTLAREMSHLLDTVISKTATVHYDLTPELPLVDGDATQIRQVLMNLLTNASDALEDRVGSITLRTSVLHLSRADLLDTYLANDLPEGAYVALDVMDTGCGMDAATRAKIFDPFYTTKFTGRGLGLASVLGIVRAHSGAVVVQSAPGEGTTFSVLLPVSRRRAARRREEHTPEVRWTGSGTILVVDDEEMVRRVAQRILERSGFTVVTAADGCEALDLFERSNGDLCAVLLDMNMPNMGGVETFRELRRLHPDVRVILTTGYDERDASKGFGDGPPAGFLQKPYRPAALVEKMREVLEA